MNVTWILSHALYEKEILINDANPYSRNEKNHWQSNKSIFFFFDPSMSPFIYFIINYKNSYSKSIDESILGCILF